MNIGTLTGTIELEDSFSSGLDIAVGKLTQFEGKLSKFGQTASQAGRTMTVGFSLPLIGAASASTLFATEFETTMTRLVSIAGVSQNELEGVKKKILELAPVVGIGPQKLALAMTSVSSTVEDTATALEILEIAAKGSAAGLGEAVDVAGALTAVVNSYGKENITAARAADILAKAVKDGGAEASELAPILSNVVPLAAQLGVSFEEVGANIATVTKLGVPATEAVTQLSSVFSVLLKETTQGEKALASIGYTYEGLRKSVGENGLQKTLADLVDRFGDNKTAMAELFGRVEGLRNIMSSAGQQAETYAAEIDAMTQSAGTLDAMFAAMQGTTTKSWGELIALVQVAAIKFGDSLAPALGSVMTQAKPVLEAVVDLVNWFGELPRPLQTAVIGFGALVAAMGPVLMFAGSVASGVSTLIPLVTSLGLRLGALKVAAAGLSLTPVGLAITALGAAAFYAYTETQRLKNEVKSFNEQLAEQKRLTDAATVSYGSTVAATIDWTKLTEEQKVRLLELERTTNANALANAGLGITIDSLVPKQKTLVSVAAEADEAAERAGASAQKAAQEAEKRFEIQQAHEKHMRDSRMARLAQEADAAKNLMDTYATGWRQTNDIEKQIERERMQRTLSTTNFQIWSIHEWAREQYDAYDGATDQANKFYATVQQRVTESRNAATMADIMEHTHASLAVKHAATLKSLQDLNQATEDAAILRERVTLSSYEFEVAQIHRAAQKRKDAYKGTEEDVKRFHALVDQQTQDSISLIDDGWVNALDGLASSFESLANMMGDTFGGIVSEIANVIGAWSLAEKSVKAFTEATNLAQKATALASGAGAVMQSTGSGGVASRTLGGVLTGGSLGKSIGGMFGPAGAAVGGVIGMIGGGAVGLIRGLFSLGESAAEKARKEAQKLRTEYIQTAGGIQELSHRASEAGITLADMYNAQNPEDFQKAVERVSAALEAQKMRAEFIEISGGIEILEQKALTAGTTLDAMLDAKTPKEYQSAVEDLNEALKFQDDAMRILDDTIEKYGFSIDQLGPKMAQQKLHEMAGELFQDYSVLNAAGVAHGAILEKMGPAVSDYVSKVVAAGGVIPESMRPVLQAFVDSKQLVDENGEAIEDLSALKFEETIGTKFETLIDAVGRLVEAITRGLNPALLSIPTPPAPWEDWPDPPTYPGGEPSVESNHDGIRDPGEPDNPQYWSGGGSAKPHMVPRGMDRVPAMLSVGERVLSAGQNSEFERQLLASRGGGKVIINANGRFLAELVVPEIPGVVLEYGLGE